MACPSSLLPKKERRIIENQERLVLSAQWIHVSILNGSTEPVHPVTRWNILMATTYGPMWCRLRVKALELDPASVISVCSSDLQHPYWFSVCFYPSLKERYWNLTCNCGLSSSLAVLSLVASFILMLRYQWHNSFKLSYSPHEFTP